MNWLLSNWDTVLYVAGSLLTVASTITKLTPTPADDAIVAQLIGFFSFLKPKGQGLVKSPLTPVKTESTV